MGRDQVGTNTDSVQYESFQRGVLGSGNSEGAR